MQQLEIRDDLTLSIGRASVRVSPSQGLQLAEKLARLAFRKALSEEATIFAPGFDADANGETLQ